MLIPRKDFIDDMFDWTKDPFWGRKENKFMRTDIKEKDGKYILEIDVPGYNKDNIKIELDNGYLIVTAEANKSNEENKDGYIHQERFFGTCSRSYYVGENIKQEEIKASFKNGILEVSFPKEEQEKIESKKYIEIED